MCTKPETGIGELRSEMAKSDEEHGFLMAKNHKELRSLMGEHHEEVVKNHGGLKSDLVEINGRISRISGMFACLNGVSLAYIMYKLAAH